MANKMINPRSFIPSGMMIRELASQSYISEADIKTILRRRGIYTQTIKKEHTVPILSCMLLSPAEFEILVERQTIKEDTFKSAGSGRIKLTDGFLGLNSFVHDDLVPNLMQHISPKHLVHSENYKIVGNPKVRTIESDKEIEIELEIERNNYNKSWVNHKSNFRALIKIKHSDDNQLIFQRFFTSSETKGLVNQCVSFAKKKCKENKYVDEDNYEHRVVFNDFDNEGRIVFFLKLFNSKESRSAGLEGDNVVSFEFCPDNGMRLPEELKWMDNKDELIFKGKKVETTFFLEERQYYKNLVVWRMQASFKFNLIGQGLSGKVRIDFNFHEFQKDRSHTAPLEINIPSGIDFDQPNISLSVRESTRMKLLAMFEDIKNKLFDAHFADAVAK